MHLYFIALLLPAVLNEKIMVYKKMMLEKYNCRVGLKSPAHITLVPPFWMDELKEEQLITDISTLSQKQLSFTIETNDFSAFKPATIFIAVKQNEELNKVRQSADEFFKNNPVYNIKIETRPFHPHITIATRDLFKKSFYEVWPWFEEKRFSEKWTPTGISILKHNKKNWDVLFTSQFNIMK